MLSGEGGLYIFACSQEKQVDFLCSPPQSLFSRQMFDLELETSAMKIILYMVFVQSKK